MSTEPLDLDALKAVVEAAQVAEIRHPRCGAFVYLRHALRALSPELRVQVGELPPHPEDDIEDGRAEIARLVRENRELRRRLDDATAERQPDLWGAA